MQAAAVPLDPRAARPLRVLIVDDSIVARTVLARMLGDRAGFTVAGMARDAAEALLLLETIAVDLILLDVAMPGRCGLTALPELIALSGGARVLIVSSLCERGAEASVRALTLGAADTLLKPTAAAFGAGFADLLVERLLRIAADAPSPPRAAAIGRPPRADPIACLAIGASTGGPHALAALLQALGPGFAAPILITQHLPPSFIPYFAEQLGALAGRPVEIARDGAPLAPGTVLLAPGDAHLALARRRGAIHAVLDRSAAGSRCCPSVDPMLTAVADVHGSRAAAVILTGMGRDGLDGAGAIAAAGGEILVQDAASAVVWGMPGAVAGAGLADFIGTPAAIAGRIAARGATA